MKKILDLKIALISLLVTLLVAAFFSWIFEISYLYSALIIGGAILANGLIIAVTEKDDED